MTSGSDNELPTGTFTVGNLQDFFSQTLTGSDTVSKAVEEKRCIQAPLGCGEPLLKEDGTPRFDHFPDRETARLYEQEWRITGMCPNCQDKLVETCEQYENEEAVVIERHDIDGCGNAPCTCQPF